MNTNLQQLDDFDKEVIDLRKQYKRERIYRVLYISSIFSFIVFYINFFAIWGIYNMLNNMIFITNVGIVMQLVFIPLVVCGSLCVLLLEGLLYYSLIFVKGDKNEE